MVDSWNRFAVAYAHALHTAGAPTPVVEGEVGRVLAARGVTATVMATPTAVWVDLDGGARVLRVPPAAPDLARQVALHRLGDRVAGGLGAEDALTELERVEDAPGPFGAVAERTAFVVAGAGSATLLGGTATDVVVASALSGLVAALLARTGHPLVAFLAASVVSTLAHLAAAVGADPILVGFAALVVLAPGVTLTLAAVETAAGHLTSGTARFAAAVVTLVQLAAGLAVPAAVVAAPAIASPVPLPGPAALALVAVAPVAIAVLHRIRPADLPYAVSVAGAATAVVVALPGPIGAGAAAFVAIVVANAIGRWRRAPAAVYAVPALVLLVPGTTSVRGAGELLGRGGADSLLSAAMVVAALAAGMLLGEGVRQPASRASPVAASKARASSAPGSGRASGDSACVQRAV